MHQSLEITYVDLDGDAPTLMRLYIGGSNYDMDEVDTGDQDVTDGKDYTYSMAFSAPGPGADGDYDVYCETADWGTDPANPVRYPTAPDFLVPKPTIQTNVAPTTPASGFSPGDGDTITQSTPLLSWDAGTDANDYDELDTLTYNLVVDDNAGFINPEIDTSLTGGVTQYQVQPGEALAAGTWYWRVQTEDEQGATSAWTAGMSFVVEDNDSPIAPTGLTPDGVTITTQQPLLDWDDSTDPNASDPPSTLLYHVQVAGDAAFTDLRFSGDTAPGVSQIQVDSDLAENGHFYWWVHAEDDGGAQSQWSDCAVAEFDVNATDEPPVAPIYTEHHFTPTSRSVDVNEADGSATDVDFVAEQNTYSISGTVTDALGTGIENVQVTADDQSTTTAAGGTYTIGGRPIRHHWCGWNLHYRRRVGGHSYGDANAGYVWLPPEQH